MSTSVTLNGVPVDNVIAGVQIRYGKQGFASRFDPMACSLQLVAHDQAPASVNVRDVLAVDVDGTRVFYGRATDRQLQLAYARTGSLGTIQAVIATGPLADFGRSLAGASSYPAELDGARAGRIITEAAPAAPLIDATITLISAASNSFDVFRSAGVDLVDPGTVTLLARPAAATNARTMIDEELDPSAPGVYETPAGLLGYADVNRRARATNVVTVPAAVVATSLTLSTGISEIVNDVTVTYGSPAATVTATEAVSASVFGTVHKDVRTQLSTSGDAQALATRTVETRSRSELNVERLVVDLEHPDLSPSLRSQLLGITYSTPITITGLDTRIGLGSSWRGFVEGWTLSITTGHKLLTMNVSPRRYSIPLANLDSIAVALNQLTGTLDDLGDLWATQRTLNQATTSINSTTGTLDTAYLA